MKNHQTFIFFSQQLNFTIKCISIAQHLLYSDKLRIRLLTIPISYFIVLLVLILIVMSLFDPTIKGSHN